MNADHLKGGQSKMDGAFWTKELRSFLNANGQLTQYPSKRRPKILSLFYLASKFEAGRQYTEKEVNEVLKAWHTFEDWAMLRRDLYDRRFMGRAPAAGVYWLEVEQPTPEDFGLENP
jgi:hypothetical protein